MIDFGVLYLQSKYINFRMVVEFLTRALKSFLKKFI